MLGNSSVMMFMVSCLPVYATCVAGECRGVKDTGRQQILFLANLILFRSFSCCNPSMYAVPLLATQELIKAIDTDGSGEIEFEEFKELLT